VTSTADSGPGSLRQAILDSNSVSAGANTIHFAIPGQGVQTIAPVSPLPPLTTAVLVDGGSQPGYAGSPVIQLDGGQAGKPAGLTITGSGVSIRGLDIVGFASGAGILITGPGASQDAISANVIGTDPTGSIAWPNQDGVRIQAGAHDNTVGGTSAGAGNV